MTTLKLTVKLSNLSKNCCLACVGILIASSAMAKTPPSKKNPNMNFRNPEFVENQGQVQTVKGAKAGKVRYTLKKNDLKVYFTDEGVSYVYQKFNNSEKEESKPQTGEVTLYRWDMELMNTKGDVKLKGKKPSGTVSNFYLSDLEKSVTKVPHYQKLVYKNVYEHTDLLFFIKDNRLKYEFIVKQGGDPGQIKLRYTGAKSLKLNDQGELLVKNPFGTMKEAAPVSYCLKGNDQQPVKSSYVLKNNILSFDLEDYKAENKLVIDPYLDYSTFLGGGAESENGNDQANDVVIDDNGNMLIVGTTQSADFPTQPNSSGNIHQSNLNGKTNAFVAKFNSNQNVQWITYFGGNGVTKGKGITYLYTKWPAITGTTNSSNLAGAQNPYIGGMDAYVASFDEKGILKWSEYIGGSSDDIGYDVKRTEGGALLYGIGETQSQSLNNPKKDLPGFNPSGGKDALLYGFGTSGSRTMASLYGDDGDDIGKGIYKGENDTVYFAGHTNSSNLRKTNTSYFTAFQQNNQGGKDLFFAKAYYANSNNRYNLRASTFLGGSNDEKYGKGLEREYRELYLVGKSNSNDYSTAKAFQSQNNGGFDAILTKTNFDGDMLQATYYGGSKDETGANIAFDLDKELYLTGRTESQDLPITNNTQNPPHHLTNQGGQDAYVAIFDALIASNIPDWILNWGTYYGGEAKDIAKSIDVNDNEDLHFVGYTSSEEFPVTQGAYQTTNHQNEHDAFATVFTNNRTCNITTNGILFEEDKTIEQKSYEEEIIRAKGDIIVEGNMELIRSKLFMDRCTQIIVKEGATLELSQSIIRACEERWNGIKVEPEGKVIVENNSLIRDADIAIQANEPANFEIKESRFVLNHDHLVIRNYGENTVNIESNEFDRLYRRYERCFTPPQMQNPNIHKMIYLEGESVSSGFGAQIQSNNFDGHLYTASNNWEPTHGIEGYGITSTDITSRNYFEDVFTRAIYLNETKETGIDRLVCEIDTARSFFDIQNSSDLTIQNGTNLQVVNPTQYSFPGVLLSDVTDASFMQDVNIEYATNGIIAFNCSNISIMHTTVAASETCIYMDQTGNSTIENCGLSSSNNGIEYYNSNAPNPTTIDHNTIVNNTYGIVVAPSRHPVGAPSTANSTSNTINLDITCNKLWNNDIGILGCGNLKQQGSSSVEAGNNFDDPNNSTAGLSKNKEWDILWQNPTPNGSGGNIDYYHLDQSTSPSGYPPNDNGLNYGTYQMNGVTHPCSSAPCPSNTPDVNYPNPKPLTPNCYAQWKKSPVTALDNKTHANANIEIYPNPFKQEIRVALPETVNGTIEVVNLQGKTMVSEEFDNKQKTINTAQWPSTTYLVKITTNKGKVHTRKLMKLNARD